MMENPSNPQTQFPMTCNIPTIDYSGFEKSWIIIHLVFCAIRTVIVASRLVESFAMHPAAFFNATTLFGILSSIGMILFGLTADILLLMRKPLGVKLGFLSLLFVIFSLAMGIRQGYIPLSPASVIIPRTFVMFRTGFDLILRITFNVVYVFVLKSIWKKLAVGGCDAGEAIKGR